MSMIQKQCLLSLLCGVGIGAVLLAGGRWRTAEARNSGRAETVPVYVDGEFVANGIIVAGTTYVPLRAVGEGLGARIDYDRNANAVMISSDPDTVYSLPTGTDIIPPAQTEGLGVVKITNDSRRDAVVKLASLPDPATRRRFLYRIVYIRAGDAASLEHITAGTYDIFFTTGIDWSERDKAFRRQRRYLTVSHSYRFEERETASGTEYAVWSLRLNPVAHGSASIENISKNVFDAIR